MNFTHEYRIHIGQSATLNIDCNFSCTGIPKFNEILH